MNDITGRDKKRILWFCGILHAFTHMYFVALIPLYLLIKEDMGLRSDASVTLLVTIQGLAYFLPSYWAGGLADKFDRKRLLSIGLSLNAVGFIGLSMAPSFAMAALFLIIAGVGGSFYHPAASSMIARLFAGKSGNAFGKVGIGAAAGFFIGPMYAGWRGDMAGWRMPVLEMGVLGLVAAAAFIFFVRVPAGARTAVSAGTGVERRRMPNPLASLNSLKWVFLFVCIFFSFRDFGGAGMNSLNSLFLQHAHDFNATSTGLALGALALMGAVSNPLMGGLSDKARMPWITLVLCGAGVVTILIPILPKEWVIPGLLLFGFFYSASFPMVDAAIMESVPDSVRGRAFGVFVLISGIVSSCAHWTMGEWINASGLASEPPEEYLVVFMGLAVLLFLAVLGLPLLKRVKAANDVADAHEEDVTASSEGKHGCCL
ncbi:MAG: MFS transporter [Verrucomicrobia bacterium]|nr:MFS transporter [Verrucomicrobiota bacterium]